MGFQLTAENAFAISLTVVLITALILSIVIYRTYIDRKERSWLGAISFVYGTSFAVLCVLVIPIDVYNVSRMSLPNGTQAHPEQVAAVAEMIRELYFVSFILLLVNAFFLIPLGFFHSGNEKNGWKHGWIGAISTSLILVAICVSEFYFLPDLEGTSSLAAHFMWPVSEEFMSLFIANMAIVGLVVWTTYVAYGLATLPIILMTMVPDPIKVEKVKKIKTAEDSELKALHKVISIFIIFIIIFITNRNWMRSRSRSICWRAKRCQVAITHNFVNRSNLLSLIRCTTQHH
jgi:hypothetical protein